MDKRRSAAPNGLTYVDAFKGVIEVEDDVFGVKREIQARWPSLRLEFDTDREKWIVTEHTTKGVWKLVFEEASIDKILKRIEGADQYAPGAEDFLEAMDKYNDKLEAERDAKFSDQIGNFAEKFAFALKKDGFDDQGQINNNHRRPRRVLNP